MKVLVVGAGVVGSVYGGRLLAAGHEVVFLARGRRLADLRTAGLVLQDAGSGRREVQAAPAVDAPPGDRVALVLVTVRAEQLPAVLPLLGPSSDPSDVLVLGNAVGRIRQARDILGSRVLFGFPGVGGVVDGSIVRYVLIRQQRTTLGELDGSDSPRLQLLQRTLERAGLPTRTSRDIRGRLFGHAAFIAPIACALSRADTDPALLAADSAALARMVRATRQAFAALRGAGVAEVPINLRALYRLPTPLVTAYWRRVLAGPRGELWFAAHTRAAPEEMRTLADEVLAAVDRTGAAVPDLRELLGRP